MTTHHFDIAGSAFAALAEFFQDTSPKRILYSGGSVLRAISALEPHISGADFWLSDERRVPLNHPENNQTQLANALPAGAHVYAVGEQMPEKWDVAVLGVGPDGHIMSLFPPASGTTKNVSDSGLTAETITRVFAISDRVTYTLKALQRAKRVIFLFGGDHKKDVLTMTDVPYAKAMKAHPHACAFYFAAS